MIKQDEIKNESIIKNNITFSKIISKYGVLIGLGIVCVIMAFLSPAFLTMSNIRSILLQVSVYGLLAIGVTLVILTGEIDLSTGSVLAVCGIVGAIIQKMEWGIVPSIIIPILLGAVLGLVNGLLVTKGGMPSFIVTLGMMNIARGIGLVITNGFPISGFNDSFKFLGGGQIFSIPVPVYFLIFFTLIVQGLLKYTSYGRNLYTIGCSRKAAFYSGIEVNKEMLKAFVICGMLAGMGGLLLASRLDSAETVAGTGYELIAVASVVIGGASLSGGIGTVFGTFIGTMLMGVIANGMTLLAINSYWQRIVTGVIIIGAVLINKFRLDSDRSQDGS